tara:strand:- start:21211 stop:21396 length:186 start_codon:yes stop_codon:yes gene_type:complete
MKEAAIILNTLGDDTDMVGDKLSNKCSITYKKAERVKNCTSGRGMYNKQYRDRGQQRHKDK